RVRGVQVIELDGAWLLPGLVDLHTNDGVALLKKPDDPQWHVERLRQVSRAQAERGVTGLFLATLAAPLDQIRCYLEGMALFRERWRSERTGAEICGALVEGTFMNPDNCGAHNPEYIFRPDRRILDDLLETGALRLVNIAPEFGEASLELIEYAASRGVVVGAGHCKPTAEQLSRAVDRGLTYFIHLYNGPSGSNTKAFYGGGTLEGALRDDRLTVELIVDFVHVDRRVLRDTIARKQAQRVVAVSDVMFACDPPPGRFEINGIVGEIDSGAGCISVVGRRGRDGRINEIREPEAQTCDFNSLFGSTANMDTVFANTVQLLSCEMEGNFVRHHPALPLEEAIRQAALMCSTVPARVAGLDDGAAGRRVGAVREGWEADLVVAEIENVTGKVLFRPLEVYIAGQPMLSSGAVAGR
ncbi:MAG: amidohydrolase family protein, partial [Candidatus Glassbacteria bacterium]